MKGYKIRYQSKNNNIYSDYDQVIYITYDSALKIMEDAQEQFPDYQFEIYIYKFDKFDDVKPNKKVQFVEFLKKIKKIQLDNIGFLDIEIVTRKDQLSTMFTFTAWPLQNDILHVYKLSWLDMDNNDNYEKLNHIKEEIKKLHGKIYN